MRRSFAALAIVAIFATSAHAKDLSGDYDCATVTQGDPLGTLRIDGDSRYGFLNDQATVADWHRFKLSAKNGLKFDGAFASALSAGATLVSAEWLADESTVTATLKSASGETIAVTCPFLP